MLINRLILVGKDIDPYDFESVIWALATRCRPGVDEQTFEDVPSFPMTPYMSHGRDKASRGGGKIGGKVLCDCVLELEYEMGSEATFNTVSFKTSYPDDVKRKVEKDWLSMGFDAV